SGILVVDEAGDVVLANASAKRILGIEAGEEVTGRRLAGLAADSQELQTLVADALRTGANASRRRFKIETKSGRRVRLGASTSCVSSSPAKVDAVIVVFAELGPTEEGRGGPVDLEPAGAAPGYLRGVLDCYDHFSAVVRETEKVQAKMDKGSLETSDVAGCLAFTKRSWEIMSAFALSLVARDSLTEIADVAAIMKSVLAGRKELAGIRLATPVRDLPRVKTVRKVFEAGLELLLAGCAGDAAGRVSATVDTVQREQAEAVEIKITEGSPRSPIARIGESLRDFVAERDLRREAGLMLLRSLADENHGVRVDQTPESLVFRIALTVPIRNGAGPAAQRGDVSDREPDGA
ncbi:MAG: PAS domain-containing protein, partial [bacterium]